MTIPLSTESFAEPAPAERLHRAATALRTNGFVVEILDHAAAARRRIPELIPKGSGVFTAASETLRLSGIDEASTRAGVTRRSSHAYWP